MQQALQQLAILVCIFVAGCAARSDAGGEVDAARRAADAAAAHAHADSAHQHDPTHDHAAHHAAADAAPHAAHDHAARLDLPAEAGAGYTVADVRFMQMMMGHHAQAIVMARLAPTHDAGERVLRLAEKIDISQRDEIAMMRRWLEERDQVAPTEEQMLAMHMPGMLTPAQLVQLDGVRGRAFDRLFLTLMIQHHEGALLMVEELFASPGAAQDPDIFRFATDVAADQGDEIFVMQRMLDALAAPQESPLR